MRTTAIPDYTDQYLISIGLLDSQVRVSVTAIPVNSGDSGKRLSPNILPGVIPV